MAKKELTTNSQITHSKECPACGGDNTIHVKFCKYCGLELLGIEPVMPKLSELVKKDTGSVLKKSKILDEETIPRKVRKSTRSCAALRSIVLCATI